MKRMLLFIFLLPLLASCCVNKTAEQIPQCILYLDGEAIHIVASEDIVQVSLSLLENSDNRIRLGVSPEMIAAIKEQDLALEILFPKTFESQTAFGRKLKINNILIPLSGEYGPDPEMASAIIFSGVDGYADGPDQNNFARTDLLRLQELLKF